MILLCVVGFVCGVLLSVFFSASEIGFLSSSLLKLRHRQEQGDQRAARVYRLLRKPEKFLATALVGTNISNVLSSSLLTYLLIQAGIENEKSSFLVTLLFTPFVVVFAELIPKNVGRYLREEFSCRTISAVHFFEKLFMPLVVLIEKFSMIMVKLVIGKVSPRSPFVTKEEIKSLIKEIASHGIIDRGEQQAIEEVFEFRRSKVKDVSVPLKNIIGLDYTDSRDRIERVMRKSGFTRYPVFKDRAIVGYVNIFDVFYNPETKWHSLIRPITKVGMNQRLYEVFATLKAKKENIAILYKGKKLYGIVTVQDIIREIMTSIVQM
ncbi:MAG: DUF21 domain-containing protein [Candidatus Omnitrophica bacterium]|nr:DUF21 domain-containing protein [Candidatus Omnitrophota bacterium]